jgi:hypothetical protein
MTKFDLCLYPVRRPEISLYLGRPMEVLLTDNFQPDLFVWGWRIGEPIITLTSVLVASFCFYAWGRLGHISESGDVSRLFRLFFLLMGLSTLIGGIVGHAFMHCLPQVCKTPGWGLGMLAVSAFEQVSILRARAFLTAKAIRTLVALNMAQLTVALLVVYATLWFPAVEIHSAFGLLLVVGPIETRLLLRNRDAVSRHILTGILMLVGGVAIHILKISACAWFCYFDIAHLFMCAAIWMFMRAAERMPADERAPAVATLSKLDNFV